MSEVDRFFRQLVSTLAAAGADRLREPILVGDITSTLLPYRTSRRALGIDTSEDYELALLRLCAGEGGLAHTEPPEALALFQAEAAAPIPDLSVLERAADAAIVLAPRRVADVLATSPAEAASRAYAPPPPAPPAPPITAVEIVDPGDPSEPGDAGDADDALPLDDFRAARPASPPAGADDDTLDDTTDDEARSTSAEQCSFCGGALPEGRTVNFCPHCGQSQSVTHCPGCKSEVEFGWRHCITCGFTLG